MSEPGTLPYCPSLISDSHVCIPSPAATCAPLPKLLRASVSFPASVPSSLWILPIGISREAGRTQIQSHPPTSAEKLAGAPCCVCVADKKKLPGSSLVLNKSICCPGSGLGAGGSEASQPRSAPLFLAFFAVSHSS